MNSEFLAGRTEELLPALLATFDPRQTAVLLDPRQVLVEHAGATITPQVAVLSPEGKVLYLGRIDNRVEDFGRSRPKATSGLREPEV